MRRVDWSIKARQDLREIISYIADDNPRAAARVAGRIEEAVRHVAAMPTGRRGWVAGTYEKVLPGLPYIIAYALETTPAGEEVVAVVRVIHGARHWPEGRWPENRASSLGPSPSGRTPPTPAGSFVPPLQDRRMRATASWTLSIEPA